MWRPAVALVRSKISLLFHNKRHTIKSVCWQRARYEGEFEMFNSVRKDLEMSEHRVIG